MTDGLRQRDRVLRQRVLALLDGGNARATARDVLARFPARRCGERPPGFAHSAWQLLEHLRIAQADILAFCTERDYRQPAWPADYWPPEPAPPSTAAFGQSAKAFLADLRRCQAIVRDRGTDLLGPLPHQADVTWLQELLLVANHNAWHLGQLMLLRRVLEAETG